MSGPREWDAGTYDRVAAPQLSWGRAVLERLELRGDEVILDAGCGSGRVTELLVARVPHGRVIAVDGSRAMIDEAGKRLGDRVELIHSDLLELTADRLGRRVDAVLSTATFHWITDHERLFARVADWLVPGGLLEAQCGGEGNVASFLAVAEPIARREPFAEHLEGIGGSRYFAGAEETEERLRAAGFEAVRCWLEDRPERPPEPRAFMESVCLSAHLAALPEELRGRFADEVFAAWGPDHTLDYVRLNISARLSA